jgi:hypothetical protein
MTNGFTKLQSLKLRRHETVLHQRGAATDLRSAPPEDVTTRLSGGPSQEGGTAGTSTPCSVEGAEMPVGPVPAARTGPRPAAPPTRPGRIQAATNLPGFQLAGSNHAAESLADDLLPLECAVAAVQAALEVGGAGKATEMQAFACR